MRARAGLIMGLALALGLGLAANAQATTIGFGAAGAFNTFILGDFHGSSDTEGGLAVGGNAYLSHYAVGAKLASSYSGSSLVVGGNLSYQDGRVYHGDVAVGGNANVSSSVNWGLINNGQQLAQNQGSSLPVDFNAAGQYLRNLSTSLAALPVTGTAGSQYGGITIQGNGTSDLQVFNIKGSDLSSATWWAALAGVPSDATIILNISGTNVSMQGGQQPLASYSSRIIFNFYQATTLTLSNISVEGSILAPLADIVSAEGVIQGQLIAKSFNGGMQQNSNPFTPYDDGTTSAATPEPGSLVLLASALALLGLLAQRRRMPWQGAAA